MFHLQHMTQSSYIIVGNIYKSNFCGNFIVKEKIRTSIKKLWELTKEVAGISYKEFIEYFKECKFGTAIVFKKIQKFTKTWGLDELRKKGDFRPPQSYCNLNDLLVGLFKGIIPQKQLNQFAHPKE